MKRFSNAGRDGKMVLAVTIVIAIAIAASISVVCRERNFQLSVQRQRLLAAAEQIQQAASSDGAVETVFQQFVLTEGKNQSGNYGLYALEEGSGALTAQAEGTPGVWVQVVFCLADGSSHAQVCNLSQWLTPEQEEQVVEYCVEFERTVTLEVGKPAGYSLNVTGGWFDGTSFVPRTLEIQENICTSVSGTRTVLSTTEPGEVILALELDVEQPAGGVEISQIERGSSLWVLERNTLPRQFSSLSQVEQWSRRGSLLKLQSYQLYTTFEVSLRGEPYTEVLVTAGELTTLQESWPALAAVWGGALVSLPVVWMALFKVKGSKKAKKYATHLIHK